MPDKIYKFRSWSDKNHKKTITRCELFLASPKDFNDPFDCRIPNSFELLDTREKRKDFIDSIIDRNSIYIRYLGFDPELEKIKRLAELEENPELFQKNDQKELFDVQDKFIGIISFCGRFDSTLMWAHYANNHKGFCLVFDEQKMKNSGLFGMGGNIRYSKDFPKIDPRMRGIEKALQQTYTKAIDWSYEQEYRLATYFFPKEPSLEDRIIKFPKDCLIEIILGMRMLENDKNEIIEIANKMEIPISQAQQEPGKFIIQKRPVPNTV